MELLLQSTILGLFNGALYALMAMGITFIASIMRIINWATGEFYMIGSYVQFALLTAVLPMLGIVTPMDWLLTALAAMVVVFMLGLLIQRTLIAPMHRPGIQSFEYATIMTVALAVLFQNLAILIAGPNQYSVPEYMKPILLEDLDIVLNGSRVAAGLAAFCLLILFYVLLYRTSWGLAFRGIAQNRLAGQTAGLNLRRMDMLAFGIGTALCAAAGALLAPVFLVHPLNGMAASMKGFEIIVIGGIGSLWGAVVAAFGLALVEALGSAFYRADLQQLYGFVFLIGFLIFRPQGLFGHKERRV
ncbi:MAG: branched-chain amino acid ABC transporter permease [Candidimonas sp.]|jgi:branched-chain amino acid transport system permease protein